MENTQLSAVVTSKNNREENRKKDLTLFILHLNFSQYVFMSNFHDKEKKGYI